jgi:hypothetical protein|nr:MAG TPA: hypothetical protein [Caudoviricetes sp.]
MYGNNYFNQNQRYQPINMMNQPNLAQPYIPTVSPMQQTNILGKVVDSLDVVKAIDIPLDGSISYFPLTNGSAIVTKQLQPNGMSKITLYKPVIEKEETLDKNEDFDKLKEDLDNLRKEFEDIKTKINVEKEA